jgi:hypothetical protein
VSSVYPGGTAAGAGVGVGPGATGWKSIRGSAWLAGAVGVSSVSPGGTAGDLSMSLAENFPCVRLAA